MAMGSRYCEVNGGDDDDEASEKRAFAVLINAWFDPLRSCENSQDSAERQMRATVSSLACRYAKEAVVPDSGCYESVRCTFAQCA